VDLKFAAEDLESKELHVLSETACLQIKLHTNALVHKTCKLVKSTFDIIVNV